MLRLLVPVLLAQTLAAQFVYDFENLSGSDAYPYTLLDGQDGWSEETFNANNRCGVTATLSQDGTRCLRFEEVGPGYGCDASRINDGAWLFAPYSGGETNAMFQCDMRVGFWGGTFGLGHDTNGDTTIRRSQPDELGVRFTLGTQANVQLRLHAVDGTSATAQLSSIGAGGGDWLRVRVVMNLGASGGAGLGSVFVQNLTDGESGFRAVSDLQDVPLGLDQAAADASNPQLWDAMWLHFEGATYALDNIQVGLGGSARPFGTACDGSFGPVALVADGPLEIGSTVTFSSDNHQPNAIGATIYGISATTHQGVPLPLSIDPIFGTNGCTLYTDLAILDAALTTAATPGALATSWAIPQFYSAFSFFVQHACLEPVPGGWSLSNALAVQLP